MPRIYLLLRNNRQTGPFTIGELLQQQLGPEDRIWVEGESTAWSPVAELELHPHHDTVPSPPRPNQPKVYVEKAGDPAPAFAYNDEDAIILVDHRKEKRNMLNEIVMTLVVVGLFAGGIYGSRTLLAGKKDIVAAGTTKIVSSEENTAKPVTNGVAHTMIAAAPADSLQKTTLPPAPIVKKTPVKTSYDTLAKTAPVTAQAKDPVAAPTNETKTETQASVQDEASKKEKRELASDKTDSKQAEKAEEPEKKRGFLKNLFRKKKKDDDDSPEKGSKEN